MKAKLLSIMLLVSTSGLSSTIEERVDELEMNALLNSIHFSGEFITRMDHIFDPYITQSKKALIPTDPADPSTAVPTLVNTVHKNTSFNVHRSLFSLNMAVGISEDLKFYGRLTASKLQNNFIALQSGESTSSDQRARGFGGTTLHVERAYFNWKMMDKLSLSVGRLPTIEGGPTHLVLGEAPRGTYPRLAYASNLDGYALTYNFGSFSVRGLYHPLASIKKNAGSSGYSYQPEWNLDGDQLRTDNELLSIMLEYGNHNLGFARNFQFTSQYFSFKNLLIDDLSIDTIDATGATSPFGIPGPVEIEFSAPMVLNYSFWVNYFEFTGLMNSGVNLAITNAQTSSKGTGFAGFMANTAGEEVKGSASMLTLSYKLPVAFLKNPIAGFEYLTSDQNYQFFNGLSMDPVGFHATRGTASHLFYNQNLTTGLKLRLGYMAVDDKYSRGEFSGEPTELTGDAKGTTSTTYAEFRVSF